MGMLWPGVAASGAAHRSRATRTGGGRCVYIGAAGRFLVAQPGLRWNICPGLLNIGRGVGVSQGRAALCAFIEAKRKPFTDACASGKVFGEAAGWGKGGWYGRGERRFRAFPSSVMFHIRLL